MSDRNFPAIIKRVEMERDQLRAQLRTAMSRLEDIQVVVDAQAQDDALWFRTQNIQEAYQQQELRALHRVIEGKP